jgi:hypothetical protein
VSFIAFFVAPLPVPVLHVMGWDGVISTNKASNITLIIIKHLLVTSRTFSDNLRWYMLIAGSHFLLGIPL